MNHHPLINAGAAALYIAAGVSVAFYVAPYLQPLEDTIAAPILMLSLLVFSVAVMGYLFFYAPAILLVQGKHAEAGKFFFSTLGFFGIFVIVLVSSILYVVSLYPQYVQPQAQTSSTD